MPHPTFVNTTILAIGCLLAVACSRTNDPERPAAENMPEIAFETHEHLRVIWQATGLAGDVTSMAFAKPVGGATQMLVNYSDGSVQPFDLEGVALGKPVPLNASALATGVAVGASGTVFEVYPALGQDGDLFLIASAPDVSVLEPLPLAEAPTGLSFLCARDGIDGLILFALQAGRPVSYTLTFDSDGAPRLASRPVSEEMRATCGPEGAGFESLNGQIIKRTDTDTTAYGFLDGMTVPGPARPGAVALFTGDAGAGFPTGVLAVEDEANQRIVFVLPPDRDRPLSAGD